MRLLTSPFLVSLTKRTNQGPQAWKMEYIPANKVSVAWQLPQYALVTAGEVMFSVTGLEFSYSQVGLFGFFNKFIYFNWRLITLQYCIGSATQQHERSYFLMACYCLLVVNLEIFILTNSKFLCDGLSSKLYYVY